VTCGSRCGGGGGGWRVNLWGCGERRKPRGTGERGGRDDDIYLSGSRTGSRSNQKATVPVGMVAGRTEGGETDERTLLEVCPSAFLVIKGDVQYVRVLPWPAYGYGRNPFFANAPRWTDAADQAKPINFATVVCCNSILETMVRLQRGGRGIWLGEAVDRRMQ